MITGTDKTNIWVKPERLLNDKRGLWGLDLMDAAALFAVFLFANTILEEAGSRYQLVAFATPVPFLAILVPIRLSKRRKYVRDTVIHWIFPKNVYDPKRY